MAYIDTKHQLYQQVSTVGRALGHETRLELIEMIAQSPQTVEKLANILSTDIKSVSAHLKVLTRAGLVTSTREGRFQRYRLTNTKVVALAVLLRETAERTLKPLSELREEKTACPDRLNLQEAVTLAQQGKLTLIDLREPEDFRAGHIPYALNVPMTEIETKVPLLPPNVPIAAYCRGPYCFLALQAKTRLADLGRNLFIISEGVMEWESQGLSLEKEVPF